MLRHFRYCVAGAVIALMVLPADNVQAQRAATGPPDWPCVQRLIPELSWGTLWAGPSPDELERDWWDDEEAARVVRYATARGTSDQEALERVRAFLEEVDSDNEKRLTLLFAGLFQEVNRERTRTINAVRRYARGQVERLDAISELVDTLEELRAEEADPERIQRVEDELFWERRLFEQRQDSLQALCDKPYLLEERLSRLVREIQTRL
ncbi:hypothetical protein ACNSTU_16745 [Aquisalimonas sp. APHAB1-3]|uniref:hypothetical protein n=1 Tax=Aquisalimonas sp. APHAB1-3 TaxID=3402080 RepID=UPI003AAD1708